MGTKVFCFHPELWKGHVVEVELDIRKGIPSFDIIGLAGSAVREARERVKTACTRAGFEFPQGRVLVNLYPADLAKNGSSYDLALALAILLETGQVTIPNGLAQTGLLVLGELGLQGEVRPVHGVLAALLTARDRGLSTALVPHESMGNFRELDPMTVVTLGHLSELRADFSWQRQGWVRNSPNNLTIDGRPDSSIMDTLHGLADYKLALAACAAGGHHLMVVGPPGVGKTMGARIIGGQWPTPREDHQQEIARIHSLHGTEFSLPVKAPLRMPHHSSSMQAILGGGTPLRPGELSMAHWGLLILDEASQFSSQVLQGLREPLETGHVHLARAGKQGDFPARATLCMTLNPCPCGNLGNLGSHCLCGPQEIQRFWAKIGGPLVDRMDIRVGLFTRPVTKHSQGDGGENLALRLGIDVGGQSLSKAIQYARVIQGSRWGDGGLNGWQDRSFEALVQWYKDAPKLPSISKRSQMAILRLGLTLADLCKEAPSSRHVNLAWELRKPSYVPDGVPFWS